MGFLDIFNLNKSSGEGRRILVVEDNEVDRKLIVKTLERQGYAVQTANNGKQGLEQATASKPEVIILDCEMPEMGGLEMCKHLKGIDDTRRIPVVFLTSLDTPSNVIDCFEADAENFLAKPIKPRVLLKEIERIFTDLATT